MFEFVKKFTRPTIDIFSYSEGILRFHGRSSLALGQNLEVNARIPNGPKFELVIQVVQKAPDGTFAARPVSPASAIEILDRHFLPDPRRSKEQMYYKIEDDPTHHVRSYVIRSQAFHRFKGITAELSVTGAKVIIEGALEEGKVIPIELDLDDVELPPFKLHAMVEWCSRRDDRYWVASLEFQDLDDEHLRELKRFLAELKDRI